MAHQFSRDALPLLPRSRGGVTYVVTYDGIRRVYAVATVTGGYRPDPEFNPDYPHVRPVKWMATEVSRDRLSKATRNTLGATQTVFLLSTDAEQEVLSLVRGEVDSLENEVATSGDEDLLGDVVSRSTEFIKNLIVRLSWEDFQRLVAGLLREGGTGHAFRLEVLIEARISWLRAMVSDSRTPGSSSK